jgi:hypothetical protein
MFEFNQETLNRKLDPDQTHVSKESHTTPRIYIAERWESFLSKLRIQYKRGDPIWLRTGIHLDSNPHLQFPSDTKVL